MGPFEMALAKFAKKAGDNADQAVRKVVIDISGRLILRSPVATGRFRANWFYGQDNQPTGTTEATDKAGSATAEKIAAAVQPEASGKVHWLSNNLPYAQRLEHGYSKQAPIGMVGLTVTEFASIVTEAAGAFSGLGVLGSER